MTKDIQRAILRACSQFILRKLEPLEKRIADMETKAIGVIEQKAAPLTDRLNALEARQPERGEKGEQGEAGAPGRDAEPVAVADVVAELLTTDQLATLVDLQVEAAVAKYFEANPVQHGKDGAKGEPGDRGEKGETGTAGADGVGLAGAMIDRDGNLIVTKTNGEAIPLGRVVGKDGAPGKDGADFSDVEFDYDGERGLIIRGKGGELVKRLPIPIDRGYWRDGMKAERGDVVTQDGSAWIALKDTSAKPCREQSDDWRMIARKGRDGLQGPPGKDYQPPQPVKLNG